jgi:hypothetical protein
MDKLVLKNSRLDSGAWFFTAAAFAVIGLLSLVGLIVANIRDPKALWMGPSVTHPQMIYIFLQGLALLCMAAMTGLAVYKGKKFFDRSIQLVIDNTGIHDHRAGGEDIAWSEITEVTEWALISGGIVTAAQLKVVTEDESTIGVDILGLDQDHKDIVKAARRMMKEAARGT